MNKNDDKNITIEKKGTGKKQGLEKLNLPKNPDEATLKKIAQALKEWLSQS
ncbi:MAG: hypothetical protein WC002_09420 [Candidatus Muiribacteriota bacterium]|jgi:hypothetical protein